MQVRPRRTTAFALLALMTLCTAQAHPQAPSAGLLAPGNPWVSPELATALRTPLEQAGYVVTILGLDDLCDLGGFEKRGLDLLVLANGAALPGDSVGPIHEYLKRGGNLIALNAPLWRHLLVDIDGEWIELDVFRSRQDPDLLQHTLYGFSPEGIGQWSAGSDNPKSDAQYNVTTRESIPGGAALHVTIPKMTGWETFVSPPLDSPFPPGHTLTVLYAKGGPGVTTLSVEWRERDNSRWIATVPLTQDWQQYVLAPEDFKFWESVPGRKSGLFQPENAWSLSLGLANSHGQGGGDHFEYWVGAVGTAECTSKHEKLLSRVRIPALDTLSPSYKYFEVTEAATLSGRKDESLADPKACPLPEVMRSPHPRPRAAGFDKGRDWRWAPLLEARTAHGQWRGTPATTLVHADGPYKGGVWMVCGIDDPAWYQTVGARRMVARAAHRMRTDRWLVDGGANFFTYFHGQEIQLGACVANLGAEPSKELHVQVTLEELGTGKRVFLHTWRLTLAPGETARLAEPFTPKRWPDEGYIVRCQLAENHVLIDSAEHEVQVWRPKAAPSFVTVEDGDLVLDGERWRAHGVNYMPSSGIGTEDQVYFEYWMGARSYDSEVIQRDLEHIRAMGMNAVSIFLYRRSLEAQNLLDLLRRLENLGIKANLSLRPGTPMDFRWDEMRELIEYYRLAENDTVFALDLAWEPMFGNHEKRRQWDPEWRAWVVERYGSLENAERDWAFAAPRDGAGAFSNPLDEQVTKDGKWRVMAAAYRRFLDTLLYEKYSQARALVRGVDPNHLVSFRMTEAGDPTFRGTTVLPYDFPYLAAAVDLLEPEGYGRIGDWERVKPALFEAEYGRWAAPEKPFLWAEAGVHAWDMGTMRSSPEKLDFQAEYYGHIYRMLTESAADGVFFWWYPGGYRANERSDYGILNPDGSDRPVTRVIRQQASAYLEGADVPAPDHWIEIDRDLHSTGVPGIYETVQENFWAAREAGKTPGLRTTATGTTSADCPLVAVGNVPYTGHNPLKYLDGFIDRIEVEDVLGDWVEVRRGDRITVLEGLPVRARIQVTNLGEAKWLSPSEHDGDGGVYLTVSGGGAAGRVPLPQDLSCREALLLDPVLLRKTSPKDDTKLNITFSADGRGEFGPRYAFVIGL